MKNKFEAITIFLYFLITIVGVVMVFNLTADFGYNKIGEHKY